MDVEFHRTFRWWLARPLVVVLALLTLLAAAALVVGGIVQGIGTVINASATWVCESLIDFQRFVNYTTSVSKHPTKPSSVEYGDDAPWGHP